MKNAMYIESENPNHTYRKLFGCRSVTIYYSDHAIIVYLCSFCYFPVYKATHVLKDKVRPFIILQAKNNTHLKAIQDR